ncbi:MAG TPA: cob(I)yrinic acid a,c-diamide adenosyltransferase [Candidatus Deferrimicrobiaceae bacterium]|nr:cob(I)yrinic acid a,c-diamide adenosyltransferase [Candidatus Deferrimicrobiaceae bacterium]
MARKRVGQIPDKPRRGLVLVLTGDGKGKTTSCLGMAVRAVGYGMRVSMIQFIKGSLHYGEIDGAKRLAPEFELIPMGKGFVGIRGDTLPFEEHVAAAKKALAVARKKMLSGRYDVIILDEVNVALHLGLLELDEVLSLVREKPPAVHLLLSGRNAHGEIVRLAHLVTEMRNIKHPYELGFEAEKGIDY